MSADEWDAMAERFHAEHERRHGYAMPDEPVEVVALRVTATVQGAEPSLTEEPGQGAVAAESCGSPMGVILSEAKDLSARN